MEDFIEKALQNTELGTSVRHLVVDVREAAQDASPAKRARLGAARPAWDGSALARLWPALPALESFEVGGCPAAFSGHLPETVQRIHVHDTLTIPVDDLRVLPAGHSHGIYHLRDLRLDGIDPGRVGPKPRVNEHYDKHGFRSNYTPLGWRRPAWPRFYDHSSEDGGLCYLQDRDLELTGTVAQALLVQERLDTYLRNLSDRAERGDRPERGSSEEGEEENEEEWDTDSSVNEHHGYTTGGASDDDARSEAGATSVARHSAAPSSIAGDFDLLPEDMRSPTESELEEARADLRARGYGSEDDEAYAGAFPEEDENEDWMNEMSASAFHNLMGAMQSGRFR